MQKILIIDDDPDVITVLQILLKKNGYEVATASREEEVYLQMKRFSPSLVIMDVLLSGVDGRDVCRKLKSNETWKHIPVIMFSAHHGAQKNMKDFGADDFLPKPFEGTKLLERVQAQLAKSSQSL
ncbi:MAG TPA: response regulator [Flavisolibacter sp.]|nr:response regulator [Flavisolibacter sp.]